jgi:Protein of unknown function (DUF3606)
MQRVKRPPERNKIDMTDPAQVRLWTRRLGVSIDVLQAAVDKVGHSIAAVTKETVEMQRERAADAVVSESPNADQVPARA